MAAKKKILFLMRDFVQAGAQRYQYELIKALNKEKYAVDVLTLVPLGSNRESGFPNEYYLPLIKNIVNDIIFLPQVQKKERKLLRLTNNRFAKPFKKISPFKQVLTIIESPIEQTAQEKLRNILEKYDFINCTDYDYSFLKKLNFCLNKLLIHVVTTKMQTFPECQFKDFDYTQRYNFAANWRKETDAFEFGNFKNGYNVYRMRLPIDTAIFSPIPYPKESNHVKIGIFTRIDYRLKPLEPFFYALHLLRNRGLNVTLHIFGAGDSSGYNRTINTLLLQNAVVFEGHQENLEDCLKKAQLHLAWFQANNYEPAGYSAYEVMGRAVPNIFWDFQPLHKDAPQGELPYPMFWNIERFVDYSQQILTHNTEGVKLGLHQYQFVVENQDSKKMIPAIEAFYDAQ